MNEAPTTVTSQGSEQLQKADEAHEAALHNLGDAATSHVFKMDASGNLMSEKEQAQEREHVLLHGHSSNESTTGR